MAESDISLHDRGRSPAKNDTALTRARSLIPRVCHLAGTAAFIDEAGLGPEGKDLRKAIRSRNTAALFDHLVTALSYQGISDEVAKNFMDRHGLASWHVIESDLRKRPSCPKLRSYRHFYDCRYNKSRFTCAEVTHLADCPLPRSWLRNGRLNQTAYSLYLFVRDIADGDLVGWIDQSARQRPHEEHDFGSFEAEGHTIFFKIDYFDRSLTYHSPDPTDPAVTVRVITVMLADEY
jgi:hypothetical protein